MYKTISRGSLSRFEMAQLNGFNGGRWLWKTTSTVLLVLGYSLSHVIAKGGDVAVGMNGQDDSWAFQFEVDLAKMDSHCTTVIVGKHASTSGAAMVSHTNDCKDCDFRVSYVPPRGPQPPPAPADPSTPPTPSNTTAPSRPVYPYLTGYPKFVGEGRGDAFVPRDGQQPTPPLGYIPDVESTYGYFNGEYGIMNEKQLMIGESTCASKIKRPRQGINGGKALLDVSELTRLAMERCTTALCAVKLIGQMSEKYGFYGPDEGGEALTIIDTDDAWILHICADPSGTSAIWVARRVPSDHVSVIANFFIIREIDLEDKENFLGSDNIYKVALDLGWWDGESEFDFAATYAPPFLHNAHYSTRRVWRVYDLLAPSLHLSPHVEGPLDHVYPFSVKPEKHVSLEEMMAIQRDFYEGTEFDLTEGVASGPFGSPNRVEAGDAEAKIPEGSWERPISMYRTTYSIIAEANGALPDELGVTWFGYDAPHSTVYMPFYAAQTDVPASFKTGSLLKFSRESAFWAFDFVSNWADLRFRTMIADIRKMQSLVEHKEISSQSLLRKTVESLLETSAGEAVASFLTNYSIRNADQVVSQWWNFADHLVAKYNDGYRNEPSLGTALGYPLDWLEEVGYSRNVGHK